MGTPIFFKDFNVRKRLYKPLSFGIITDIHKDLMPDADERLAAFIKESTDREVDFIIQLGDFCFKESKNDPFLAIWNKFAGDKFHILGNHDMDKNTKTEIMDYWSMPKPYYSFDKNGIHFIVLDANYIYKNGEYLDYANANFYIDSKFRTFINPKQIEWFKADLSQTNLPTIVCSHQSLWNPQNGVKNTGDFKQHLEKNADKIICCLNGHNHVDQHQTLNGIDYIDINSASYQWMNNEYTSTERFSPELYLEYPNLPHIAGYTKPLFCFAQISHNGKFSIEGRNAKWMKPSPFDLGKKKGLEKSSLATNISNRVLSF